MLILFFASGHKKSPLHCLYVRQYYKLHGIFLITKLVARTLIITVFLYAQRRAIGLSDITDSNGFRWISRWGNEIKCSGFH